MWVLFSVAIQLLDHNVSLLLDQIFVKKAKLIYHFKNIKDLKVVLYSLEFDNAWYFYLYLSQIIKFLNTNSHYLIVLFLYDVIIITIE